MPKTINIYFKILVFSYLFLFAKLNSQAIDSSCLKENLGDCTKIGASHVLVFNDPNTNIKANLIAVHGMSMCARAYTQLGLCLLKKYQIATYCLNVRGFGPLGSDSREEKLDLIDTTGDIRLLINILHAKNPNLPIILLGESMGASLVLATAANNPEFIDGIVASSPAWKIKKLKRNIAKGILQIIIEPKKKLGLASKGIVNQATNDPNLINHIETSDSHKLKLSLCEAINFLRFIHKTSSYAISVNSCNVMILQGLQDNLVKPESAAYLYKDCTTKHKEFILDCKASHLIFEENQYNSNDIIKLVEFISASSQSNNTKSNFEIVSGFQTINKEFISKKYKRTYNKIVKILSNKSKHD